MLCTVIQLGLADALGQETLTAGQLAHRVGTPSACDCGFLSS